MLITEEEFVEFNRVLKTTKNIIIDALSSANDVLVDRLQLDFSIRKIILKNIYKDVENYYFSQSKESSNGK